MACKNKLNVVVVSTNPRREIKVGGKLDSFLFISITQHMARKIQKLTCKPFFLSSTRGMTVDMLHLPNTWYLQCIKPKTAHDFVNISFMHLSSVNEMS